MKHVKRDNIMKKLTLTLSKDLHAGFRIACFQNNESMTKVLMDMIRIYIDKQSK